MDWLVVQGLLLLCACAGSTAADATKMKTGTTWTKSRFIHPPGNRFPSVADPGTAGAVTNYHMNAGCADAILPAIASGFAYRPDVLAALRCGSRSFCCIEARTHRHVNEIHPIFETFFASDMPGVPKKLGWGWPLTGKSGPRSRSWAKTGTHILVALLKCLLRRASMGYRSGRSRTVLRHGHALSPSTSAL